MASEPTLESAGQDNLEQFGTLAPVAKRTTAALSTDTMTLPGASPTVAQIEADALAWCVEHKHSQRDRGRQACRDCPRGPDGHPRPAPGHPPPAGRASTIQRHLHRRPAGPGGVWKLADILAALNEHRRELGRDPYTETGCSARIRDLRKAGRHISQRVAEDGGAEYWNADLVTA